MADQPSWQVTVDRPAEIPIASAPANSLVPSSRRQLMITVVGYRPSAEGSVEVVVDAVCGSQVTEIGRFGILSPRPFTPADPDRAQRFGLPLGPCMTPSFVSVRVVPSRGSGVDATVELTGAELR